VLNCVQFVQLELSFELRTRLPSNLRRTTREWAPLVTRGHFRSRDKIGDHAGNPMLHVNFMALCFMEPKSLPIEVLHYGNSDFLPFVLLGLDLDPMTFLYELDPYSLDIYRMCRYELPTARLSKVLVWQRQTNRQTDTTELIYYAASLVVSY